jgi:hypothetical protein
MQHSFRYPGDEVMQQILQQCECGAPRTLPLPSQTECINLRDSALTGNQLAIERVFKLYHNAVVPATAPERVSLAIIFDAYAQVNRKIQSHAQKD